MRVLRYFVRAYPGQSLAVLVCLIVAAAAEGVGYSALLPLLTLAIEPEEAAPATPSGFDATVRDALERVGIEPTLQALSLIFLGALWLRGAILLLSRRQVGYTVARIATDFRLRLLRALLSARWSYFTRQRAGTAANAMATEAQRASFAYHNLALMMTGVIDCVIYTGVALAMSWQATLGAMTCALITVSALSALVRMSGRAGHKQVRLLKSLLGRLTDTLQAAKRLKAGGREQALAALLDRDSNRLNRQLQRRVFSKEALRALQEPIVYSLILGGFVLAMTVVDMAFPSVAVLALLFGRTLSCINTVQRKYQAVVVEESAVWSVHEMIEQAERESESSGDRAPQLERGIELRGVHVRHGEQSILENVNLEIPVGSITAIVGPSGGGKTTVVDLITGLVEPESGQILVDGVPLPELDLRAWRRMVGYVPQDVALLHDSIRNNVTFGDPDVSDAAIEQALRQAGAWEFIARLPEGLDMVVGERGSLLSGGQRQRIGIASALVHHPRLLILDEATGALDARSEAEIWAAVERLRGRMTVIAVSHQSALGRVADRAYRIANGRASPVDASRAIGAEGRVVA
jgi:ATP-binding cassette subfamily C protein